MSIWPFRPSRASEDAEKLLNAVTEASRRPAFFGPGRVPDTLEGRFELMTLNASLALLRLRSDPACAPLAQTFTDRLFRFFDAGLREDGVGDLTVPKRMRKLASAFYGRLQAYGEALEATDTTALTAAVERNILGEQSLFAPLLAGHVKALWRAQAAAPPTALMEASGWAGELG